MFTRSRRAAWCLAAGGLLSFPSLVKAQLNGQRLRGEVVPAVSQGRVRRLNAMPKSQIVRFSVILPLRNEAQLNNLLSRLYDPASPDYRHFLSVSEFTDEFAPSAADYQEVVDYAIASGFTVGRLSANRLVVPLTASVDQIERALHVQMNVYQHPTEKRTFFSPDREPSLSLSVPILRIEGLDNFSLPRPMIRKSQDQRALSSFALQGSGPGGSYLGSDMRAAYYGGDTLTGAGQTLALFELDGYFRSDLDLTFSNAGQSYSVPVVNVLLDGTDGTPALTGDDAEQVMDMAQAIAMAPGLDELRVYIGSIPVDVLNAIAADGIARQVSVSWAWQSADQTVEDQVFKELAAQGQNVFVASGDDGAFAPGYQFPFPSEDPWVTAVGGTVLQTEQQGGAWASEVAWNRSGGGISTDNFAQPEWQDGTATLANGGSATLRNVPDVAMQSDTDNYACDMGLCSGYWGGTSFAAPRWAGFLALVNEQAAAAGDQSPGFIDSALYSLGNGTGSPFHDVTSGSNPSISDPSVSFPAVAGYDLVTGWGSPAGQAFIDAMAPWSKPGFQLAIASTSLSIDPGASGTLPIAIVFRNGFAGAVNLAVSGLPAGVTASWSANPASEATLLTLTAGSDLARGQYQISVTGASGNLSAKVNCTLLVNAPGFSITPMPMSFLVNDGTSYSLTFTVNGLGGFADPVSFAMESPLPAGISAVWQTQGSGPPMLTVNAAGDAQPGLFPLTIVATSGKLSSTAIVEMRVSLPEFVINLAPAPTAIAQGGSFIGTVNLASIGAFDGEVSLSAPTVPSGVTASFNPASISGAQTSQLTLTASSKAPPGTGNLFLVGSAQSTAALYSVPLNVIAAAVPNFTLTESPTTLTIPQGGSASTTITVNPSGGFANDVYLSIPGFPGVTSSFSVNPTTLSSVATIKVADSVPAASYWLTISGSSALLSASGTIFLQVTPSYPFDIAVTPNPIALLAGESGSGTVTITPHGALSGNVELAVAAELPDGISASFVPAATQANSSLLITASSSVPVGNYAFNVSGATASETATETVTVNIAAPVPGSRIASLSPAHVPAQASNFSLTVNGSGFDADSVVYWQGTALTTQFVSATSLTAIVTSAQLANPGVVSIQVKSADVTGSSSNSQQFEVDSSAAAVGAPQFPSPAQSVVAGGTAQYPVSVPSAATNLAVTCLNLPADAACSYSESEGAVSITTTSSTPSGSYQVTVVFTETVSGTTSAVLYLVLLPPFALRRKLQRQRAKWICIAIVTITILASFIGCGGSSIGMKNTASSPAPAPTYQVTSSGTVTLTVQ